MKYFFVLPAVVCAAAVSVFAAEEQAPLVRENSVALDGYAAAVNGRIITVGDAMVAAAPLDQQSRIAADSETALKTALQDNYKKALDRLIERAMILEEAARKVKENPELELPEAAVEDQITGIVRERFDGRRNGLIEALAAEGMTMDDYRRQTRERMEIFRLRRSEVTERVMVPPGRVHEEYDLRKETYTAPEEIHLRMVVVQKGETEDEQAAKQQQAARARQRIKSGEAFEVVAKTVSEGPKADQGGDVGWVKPGDLRAELREAVTGLATGDVSDVVKTSDGYYLVQVLERKSASLRPFDEVRGDLERELMMREEDRLMADWMARLRARHYIRMYQPERPEMP